MRDEAAGPTTKRDDEAARAARPGCASCAHFCSDPSAIERAVPGLLSFGSGYAAVRDGDGLCARHGRYLASGSVCADWKARD